MSSVACNDYTGLTGAIRRNVHDERGSFTVSTDLNVLSYESPDIRRSLLLKPATTRTSYAVPFK